MDANEFMKAQELRASATEIKVLALQWHTDALRKALDEANAEIKRLGGRAIPAPKSALDGD